MNLSAERRGSFTQESERSRPRRRWLPVGLLDPLRFLGGSTAPVLREGESCCLTGRLLGECPDLGRGGDGQEPPTAGPEGHGRHAPEWLQNFPHDAPHGFLNCAFLTGLLYKAGCTLRAERYYWKPPHLPLSRWTTTSSVPLATVGDGAHVDTPPPGSEQLRKVVDTEPGLPGPLMAQWGGL